MQAKKRCALVMYDNKVCGVVVELLWDGDLVNFDDSWDRRLYTIKIMWIARRVEGVFSISFLSQLSSWINI